MGLWTGPLIVSTIGTEDFKAFAFTGLGVTRVMALQQYAAMFGRCIITNADVFAATANEGKHRLVPVDVLSLAMRTAQEKSLDLGLTRTPKGDTRVPMRGLDSEIVYECVASVDVKEDEWMYQLQVPYRCQQVIEGRGQCFSLVVLLRIPVG